MVVEQRRRFEDMTNISKETRTMLESNFVINHIKVDTIQRSDDGTIKMQFVLMV
jgi:23S rRNA (adenine2503-C2)-methyltransferase